MFPKLIAWVEVTQNEPQYAYEIADIQNDYYDFYASENENYSLLLVYSSIVDKNWFVKEFCVLLNINQLIFPARIINSVNHLFELMLIQQKPTFFQTENLDTE